MGRVSTLIKVTLVAFATSACGSRAVSTDPKPPPRNDETAPRAVKERERQPAPKLIAPPPAYGHKIVMAHGPTVRSVN